MHSRNTLLLIEIPEQTVCTKGLQIHISLKNYILHMYTFPGKFTAVCFFNVKMPMTVLRRAKRITQHCHVDGRSVVQEGYADTSPR
jgi:hypothetical protein